MAPAEECAQLEREQEKTRFHAGKEFGSFEEASCGRWDLLVHRNKLGLGLQLQLARADEVLVDLRQPLLVAVH